MFRAMEREFSVICVLVSAVVMLTSVVGGASIKRSPSDLSVFQSSDPSPNILNSFMGNSRNDGNQISINHSGQFSTDGENSQGIVSAYSPSGDVSLSMSGSGQQVEGETATTGKRAAGTEEDDQSLPARAICPFTFVEDENPNRQPTKMLFAQMSNSEHRCLDPNSSQKAFATQGVCVMVHRDFQVQIKDKVNDSWTNETIQVPVARVCVLDK